VLFVCSDSLLELEDPKFDILCMSEGDMEYNYVFLNAATTNSLPLHSRDHLLVFICKFDSSFALAQVYFVGNMDQFD